MRMRRSRSMRSNPMIQRGMADARGQAIPAEGVMTVAGTRNKTLLLTLILAVSFIGTMLYSLSNPTIVYSGGVTTVASIAALVLAFATIFKPHLASKTAPMYAVVEGILLGSISLLMEVIYPGIVMYAVVLTILVVLFTLVLYKHSPEFGMKIRKGVMIATAAVMGTMLLGMFFSLFGIPFVFYGSSTLGIGFSLLVVGLAAANLIVDYDNVYLGAQNQFPKHMEWFFAFGIMVTVIWLYTQILRLLAQFAARD